MSLRSYLVQRGNWIESSETHIDASQQLRTYTSGDRCMTILRQIYHLVQEAYDDRRANQKSEREEKKSHLW